MHFLVQGSTEHNIEFLVSPAQGQNGYARFECALCQWQCQRIAIRIMQCSGLARLTIVVVGLDVRGAAR